MRNRYRIIMALMAAAISLLALGLLACNGKLKGEPVTPIDGVFRIDASRIGAGESKFFRYKDIVFLVARSDSGAIKTAFDACKTCYTYKKGYRQEEDCVVCIYCGNRFKIEDLDKGIGNCVPIRIRHRIDGDTVILDQKELESGAVWF